MTVNPDFFHPWPPLIQTRLNTSRGGAFVVALLGGAAAVWVLSAALPQFLAALLSALCVWTSVWELQRHCWRRAPSSEVELWRLASGQWVVKQRSGTLVTGLELVKGRACGAVVVLWLREPGQRPWPVYVFRDAVDAKAFHALQVTVRVVGSKAFDR